MGPFIPVTNADVSPKEQCFVSLWLLSSVSSDLPCVFPPGLEVPDMDCAALLGGSVFSWLFGTARHSGSDATGPWSCGRTASLGPALAPLQILRSRSRKEDQGLQSLGTWDPASVLAMCTSFP